MQMKRIILITLLFLGFYSSRSQIFINEISYSGTTAHPGQLDGWRCFISQRSLRRCVERKNCPGQPQRSSSPPGRRRGGSPHSAWTPSRYPTTPLPRNPGQTHCGGPFRSSIVRSPHGSVMTVWRTLDIPVRLDEKSCACPDLATP